MQNLFQKFRRILFDLNILKRMREMITGASAVTINAAVRASTIQVHAIVCGKNGFSVDKMHGIPPYPVITSD
jgi:hypothetical protein